MNMKPQLISFKLCPFVQRSVITLLEKGIDFDITYIDIKDPPQWFLDISPFGKVPVLRAGDTVLFESAVINEYLDEVNPPPLHPTDPLQRAINRMWIEYGSNLNFELHSIMVEKDAGKWAAKVAETKKEFARVEQQLGEGPFFNGEHFSLADAAYAPPLVRSQLLDEHFGIGLLNETPKMAAWGTVLAQRESVQRSVVPEFEQLFLEHIQTQEGHLSTLG
jgi:glutathione S-transferase